jgi:hypothetical protein
LGDVQHKVQLLAASFQSALPIAGNACGLLLDRGDGRILRERCWFIQKQSEWRYGYAAAKYFDEYIHLDPQNNVNRIHCTTSSLLLPNNIFG